jgi:D-alanyl-D-alanine carboxypeptidase
VSGNWPRGTKTLLHQVVEGSDRAWSIREAMDIVRAAPGAHFAPRPFDGRRHTVRYSDTNFQLLIAVIEAVTQRPVHEAFAELLYQRLGLERTWHPGTP